MSRKKIYWSNFLGKSKERIVFYFLHCPFEPTAKQHRPVSQLGWILWCMLARPQKGQCRHSKNFPPLLLAVKVDQNIIFPETCFASTISEPVNYFRLGHAPVHLRQPWLLGPVPDSPGSLFRSFKKATEPFWNLLETLSN